MRRSHVTAIAVLTVLAVTTGAGILAFQRSDSAPVVPADGSFAPAIAQCVPTVATRTGSTYADAGAVDCLVEVMIQAYTTGRTAEFSTELQAAVDKDRALYDVCHPAAHTAGLRALQRLEDPVAALDAAAGSTVCDWGMGHGIMDSLSEQNPSIEVFDATVAWCDRHQADIRLYGLCTDGLGHLAWGATESFDESIKLCERVGSSAGRMSCGGGILMQVFAPVAHDAALPLNEAPDMMAEVCADWAGLVSADGALDGCYLGAAYLFSLPIKDKTFTWWDSPAYKPGSKIPTSIQTGIETLTRNALDTCARFPQEGRMLCETGLANHVLTRYANEHPAELKKLCSIFPPNQSRKVCMSAGQEADQ